MSVFNKEAKNHLTQPMFLGDEELGMQRYETMKYPVLDKLTDTQLGFFWRPQEVDLTKDSKDFKDLTSFEEHIFTSNLKRQILLDSVQGRSPNLTFLSLITLPELEAWNETWAFNETIHSRAYTYVIQNVYPNPSIVLDEIMEIPEIIECSEDITKYYNDLEEYARWYKLLGEGKFTVTDRKTLEQKIITVDKYELKKKIWLALLSVNILEGIRFYVSFACSWAFGELKKMEGNAKILKLICRDENVHLAFTQTMIKLLPKDDPDFAKIQKECYDEARDMYLSAVQQEKEWAKYLFKDGSMIGLNEQLLVEYLEWIAHKRMNAVNLDSPFKGGSDPLPWTQKWISGSEVQVASQETEITSYVIGAVNMDVKDGDFDKFKL